MNSSPDSYTYNPSIRIVFTDSNDIETHDIETNGERFKDGPNNYKEWTKPFFSSKGSFTTEERATSDVMKERSKMYDDINETIFANSKHNVLGITYNFASLKANTLFKELVLTVVTKIMMSYPKFGMMNTTQFLI